MSTPVIDPFGARGDPKLRTLARALDPAEAQAQFRSCLPRLAGGRGAVSLRAVRVVWYKPRRRCQVEYDVEVGRPGGSPEAVTLIGKVRRGRSGEAAYHLLDALWRAGFASTSADGTSVPEPVGVVPAFDMWFQRKVPGRPATDLLPAPGGAALARRVAEAAHKLHRSGVPAESRHTMADELRRVGEDVRAAAQAEPRWSGRLERLCEACRRLARATPEPVPLGIHRDFHPDQVLADGDRLYLIDFDHYHQGDPGLDVGYFLSHLVEQGLRTRGDAEALAPVGRALEERFVELSGEAVRPAVRTYATLSLVRQLALSTQDPAGRPLARDLLELCERRLVAGSCGPRAATLAPPAERGAGP